MTKFFPEALNIFEEFSDRFDARRIQTEKADIYFASYHAGTEIESHSHDTENYGVITKGCLHLEANGEWKQYKTGDWYHVPKGVDHSTKFDEDTAEIEIWIK